MLGELDGIAEQVDQHLTQLAFVPPDQTLGQILGVYQPVQVFVLTALLKHQVQRAGHALQLEAGRIQLLASGLDLGDIENVVDQ